MTKMKLVTTCVQVPQAQVQDLHDMMEGAREVSFKTFCRHCDWQPVAQRLGYAVGGERGLRLGGDYHVRFHRSKWRGKRCYYMVWSAIEHVFQ